MIDFGLALYFTILIFLLVFAIILLTIFKDQQSKITRRFLIILAFINFALHFLKILLPPYSDVFALGVSNNFPYSLYNLSFDNICSVNTILLPFALLSKKQGFKDSVLALSFVGGLLAILYPYDFLYQNVFVVDAIRYYICHFILLIVPLFAIILKVHKVSYKSFYKIPLFLIFEMAIILFNNSFLSEIGLLNMRSDIAAKDYFNTAFVYGPYFGKEDTILKFLDIFVPKFLKTVPQGFTYFDTLRGFYDNGGVIKYWPILWAIGPIIIYVLPLSFIILGSLDFKNLKNDLKKTKS